MQRAALMVMNEMTKSTSETRSLLYRLRCLEQRNCRQAFAAVWRFPHSPSHTHSSVSQSLFYTPNGNGCIRNDSNFILKNQLFAALKRVVAATSSAELSIEWVVSLFWVLQRRKKIHHKLILVKWWHSGNALHSALHWAAISCDATNCRWINVYNENDNGTA